MPKNLDRPATGKNCSHTPLPLGATEGPVRTRERIVRELQAYKQAAKNLNRTEQKANLHSQLHLIVGIISHFFNGDESPQALAI